MRAVLLVVPAPAKRNLARFGVRCFCGVCVWRQFCGSYAQRHHPAEVMLRLLGLVGYLPIIDIPMYHGGEPVVRHASYNGLTFVCTVLIVVGLALYFGFLYFYQKHPLAGKVILVVGIWWLLRQMVRFFKALCDDPYTRTKPYERD